MVSMNDKYPDTQLDDAFGHEHDCIVASLRARIAELEHRLEIDREYMADETGNRIEVEIPPQDRDKASDGIDCRDATIKLQDEHIVRLREQNAALREAIAPFQTNVCEAIASTLPDEREISIRVTIGELRRVRALLSGTKEADNG